MTVISCLYVRSRIKCCYYRAETIRLNSRSSQNGMQKARIRCSESGLALLVLFVKTTFVSNSGGIFSLLFGQPPAIAASQVGQAQEQSYEAADRDKF